MIRTAAIMVSFLLATGAVARGQANAMKVVDALLDAAEPGATVLVPAGVYEGHLVVRKPVTIDGADKAIFDGGGKGTVIEIRSPGVTIRRCAIRGSGSDVTGEPAGIRAIAGQAVIESNTITDALFGIDLRESPGSIVRNNTISGKDLEPGRRGDAIRLWWSHNCIVEDNTAIGTRDLVFWYSENLRITRNTVTDSRYGLHFMYSHDTVLSANILNGNSVGVYLMYSNRISLDNNEMTNNRGASGYGIGLKDCDDIDIENNHLLANRVGLYIDNSPSSFDSTGLIRSNMIAFNEIGLLATPNTHGNVITANAFLENEQQAAAHGRGALTSNDFSSDDGTGNFWSDYAGFDRDGDGVGDIAYRPQSLFSAMLADVPNLRLFVHSPAQQAIEFTARALPELRPEPTLVDAAPLTRVPVIPGRTVAAHAAGPMAWIGLGLLTLGGGCALAFGRVTRLPPATDGDKS